MKKRPLIYFFTTSSKHPKGTLNKKKIKTDCSVCRLALGAAGGLRPDSLNYLNYAVGMPLFDWICHKTLWDRRLNFARGHASRLFHSTVSTFRCCFKTVTTWLLSFAWLYTSVQYFTSYRLRGRYWAVVASQAWNYCCRIMCCKLRGQALGLATLIFESVLLIIFLCTKFCPCCYSSSGCLSVHSRSIPVTLSGPNCPKQPHFRHFAFISS